MNEEIIITERTLDVPLDTIVALIKKAHSVNITNGLHYGTAEITVHDYSSYIEFSHCFIALSGEKLVGTCMMSEMMVHHWYYTGKAAYIHLVAVDPDYHGKGIGTKLINEILSRNKREWKYPFCFITTAEKNTGLRRICEKLDFHLLWFSTYEENNFYSVVYGKWIANCPYSKRYIKYRYTFEKCIVKLVFKPGRRIRFCNEKIVGEKIISFRSDKG